MRTTIDGAGRLVVPKALRDALGLGAGDAVEVAVRDGILEISMPPTELALRPSGGTVVAVPERGLPELSAEQVRATLEQTRR